MTIIKNVLNYPISFPVIPEELSSKIEIVPTFPISDRESELFHYCLVGLIDQLKYENINIQKLQPVVVLFTSDGEFGVYQDKKNFGIGYTLNFIVYCVDFWRSQNYSEINIMTVFMEELCHHFFGILDEEEVKYKVLDVINRIFNNEMKFNDLYAVNWKDAYSQIYHKE